MVNKKMRLFKLLFFPISLLICLSIFMISSFASPGYFVENNGNIKSLNLIENGVNVSGSNDALYFNCSLSANTTYSFKLYGGNNTGAYSLWSTDANDNFIEEFTSSTGVNSSLTFTTTSNASKIGIYPNNINNTNLMLNEGSTILEYFPYGYFYSGNVYSNYTIYSIFNGVRVYLWDDYGGGPLATDTLSLNENDKEIDYHDIPNIVNYFQSHSSSNLDYYLQFDLQNSPTSASLSVELNSYNIANYCSVVVNNGRNTKRYTQNVNSNVVIVNTFNDIYSILDIGLFTPTYSSYGSFRLTLISADTSNYNYGYSNGYNDGLNDGESIGYQSGYQSGYNTGTTTNIETNGIRTLFNSILSFPVDMIKSVFNFEFMGVNVASVIMFIISIGIVAFVLKKFL